MENPQISSFSSYFCATTHTHSLTKHGMIQTHIHELLCCCNLILILKQHQSTAAQKSTNINNISNKKWQKTFSTFFFIFIYIFSLILLLFYFSCSHVTHFPWSSSSCFTSLSSFATVNKSHKINKMFSVLFFFK